MEGTTTTLEQMWENPTIRKIVILVIVAIVILTAIGLVKRALSRYIEDKDSRYRSRKVANFAGYLLVGLAVAVVFNEKLGGLGVTLGVAGAGIAFALQEVIVSFAGWIGIASGGFFKTGDRVQLGGIRGDVIDIGVLRTTLMETGNWVDGDLYNGRIVRVANSFVFKEPVFNYNTDFPFLWDEIKIPIRFGSDLKMAKTIITEIADEFLADYASKARDSWDQIVRKFLIEDARVEPMITLIANDNWVEFTLRYVVDYKKRRGTKDVLWSSLLERFDATNGKVRMASATFELTDAPNFNISLNQ